ncbi:MAG: PIN domain-containing protein [Rudaea sp.]|uniref:PIN domain-containing protein n=1 Tax=Rudaea sp. TaxID=2136325 RepID=UPI0039E3918D
MRSFVDSNVIVYAEASDEKVKQKKALRLLRELKLSGEGVVSTQVLQEYCNVGLRKLKLSSAHLRLQLASLQQFDVVQIDGEMIQAALDLHQTRSIAFYDALIVVAAQCGGCGVLYSEDMQAGEVLAQVRIVNPFA